MGSLNRHGRPALVPHLQPDVNPTSQGARFDPDGDYVRRWIPELAQVAHPLDPAALGAPCHQATTVAFELGRTYPTRIVLHEERRPLALAMYGATRG